MFDDLQLYIDYSETVLAFYTGVNSTAHIRKVTNEGDNASRVT